MTSTTPSYRAQTDPTTKKWHLGSAERGTTSYCGVRLVDPGDTRPFALKVAEADRHIETSPELERVDCGACRRNREWKYAHGTARPEPATRTRTTARTRGQHAAATREAAENDPGSRALSRAEAAALAAAAADRNGNGHTTPTQERAALDARVLALLATYPAGTSHAPADLRTAMDPRPTMATLRGSLKRLVRARSAVETSAGWYAVAPPAPPTAADTLAKIEAAVAETTGEPTADDASAADLAARTGLEPLTAAEREAAANLDALLLTPGETARTRRGKRAKTGNPAADRAASDRESTVPAATRERVAREMSRPAKARALVESGECENLAAARAYLTDMGE
jgi:hypothetical protein